MTSGQTALFPEASGQIGSISHSSWKEDHTLFDGQMQLGVRLRVEQIESIDTSLQRYAIRGWMDRDWLATQEDIKRYDSLNPFE